MIGSSSPSSSSSGRSSPAGSSSPSSSSSGRSSPAGSLSLSSSFSGRSSPAGSLDSTGQSDRYFHYRQDSSIRPPISPLIADNIPHKAAPEDLAFQTLLTLIPNNTLKPLRKSLKNTIKNMAKNSPDAFTTLKENLHKLSVTKDVTKKSIGNISVPEKDLVKTITTGTLDDLSVNERKEIEDQHDFTETLFNDPNKWVVMQTYKQGTEFIEKDNQDCQCSVPAALQAFQRIFRQGNALDNNPE